MSLSQKIEAAQNAQKNFSVTARSARETLLMAYADALKAARLDLAATLAKDAKKSLKDAQTEVDASVDTIGAAIKNATLPDLGDMVREKNRQPVGLVGLITSFNFPMVVAHWNIAPGLLAGNAILWKPSEKTPFAALACKKIFDTVAGNHKDVLQIIEGGGDVGAELVAHEAVDLISATGSVAMGEAIKKTLAKKVNNRVPPILELGGNNAVVIGEHMTDAHLDFALNSILTSFLGTTGQRCTNTRRLIVHQSWFEKTVASLEKKIGELISSGEIKNPENIYGYNQLIDEDAEARFEYAKGQAQQDGGRIVFGGKNEPALAIMHAQTDIMHTETFAPFLYVVSYQSGIEAAMALVNAPDNAGLVNGIYTLSQLEADQFAALNEAGHTVINSAKGTGVPANGMGFAGNKASGSGEILWNVDPLAAFTKPEGARRIARNKNIPLS